MSESQKEAAQLPDPNTAATTVFDRVEAQAFFNKLASLGVEWQTEDEAIEYLKLGDHLMQQAAQAPAAKGSGEVYKISEALGLRNEQTASHEYLAEVGKVAADLMQDPEIYNSVLSIKAAEAQYYHDAIMQSQGS